MYTKYTKYINFVFLYYEIRDLFINKDTRVLGWLYVVHSRLGVAIFFISLFYDLDYFIWVFVVVGCKKSLFFSCIRRVYEIY